MAGRILTVAAVVVAIAVGSAGYAGSGLLAGGAAHGIPLLLPWSLPSIDRDLPPAVRARLEQEVRAWQTRARAAAQQPATAAAGCVPNEFGHPGAPAPKVTARIIGHHVEVVFAYAALPTSDACRPFVLTVVTAGEGGQSYVREFRVSVLQGRVVLDLPWGAVAPYRLVANAETILGRRGPSVELALRCPRTRDAVKGCLPGYRPALHSWTMPAPVLPLRGIDRRTLEASLRYVVAGERPAVRTARCPSLRLCELTYVDPAFPRTPYRVPYRIAGQQIDGCWMGMQQAVRDPLPYLDVHRGPLELAGCSSWLR